ncbi:hypothetical protein B0H34DRAFT_698434 [Crassisporium funariophilum]|nr:hypothetical protein B0H34DRAFT_698434 [Crassisporium funariophilum]
MGLSDRKVKQRIPDDPRNLCWADDAARFGSNYLSKFGWDASKGLGVGGDGRTSHIKVSHKLDMLGIGAAQKRDPDGIAWKQNKDFEVLLERLNAGSAEQVKVLVEDELVDEEHGSDDSKKKRKHKEAGKSETGTGREKKRRKEGSESGQDSPLVVEAQAKQAEEQKVTSVQPKVIVVPRHRAHRARAIAAKNISSKSAAHISEILGIGPTSLPSRDTSQGKLTSTSDDLESDKITTSTKSVADYFKEKLQARSVGIINSSAPSSSTTLPEEEIDAYDAPRIGLGSRSRVESHSETKVDQETLRLGLSSFSSLKSSFLLASTSSFSIASETPVSPSSHSSPTNDDGNAHTSDAEPKPRSKSEKKGKKKEKKLLVEEKMEREGDDGQTDSDEDAKTETKEERKKRRREAKRQREETAGKETESKGTKETRKTGSEKTKKEKKRRTSSKDNDPI